MYSTQFIVLVLLSSFVDILGTVTAFQECYIQLQIGALFHDRHQSRLRLSLLFTPSFNIAHASCRPRLVATNRRTIRLLMLHFSCLYAMFS